ncbi:MAG: hypothetical protein LRY71_01325 [Bacillaceae bacterium]|nr:hypothetical protein [Bacillaceae bacterium]
MKEKFSIEDLSEHQLVMEEITELEQKIQQKIGKEVALVAFLKEGEE